MVSRKAGFNHFSSYIGEAFENIVKGLLYNGDLVPLMSVSSGYMPTYILECDSGQRRLELSGHELSVPDLIMVDNSKGCVVPIDMKVLAKYLKPKQISGENAQHLFKIGYRKLKTLYTGLKFSDGFIISPMLPENEKLVAGSIMGSMFSLNFNGNGNKTSQYTVMFLEDYKTTMQILREANQYLYDIVSDISDMGGKKAGEIDSMPFREVEKFADLFFGTARTRLAIDNGIPVKEVGCSGLETMLASYNTAFGDFKRNCAGEESPVEIYNFTLQKYQEHADKLR